MIVLTLGTFDLFHGGHVRLLRRCHELAGPTGQVVVGLNTDDFVERYKGLRPAWAYEVREAALRSCRFVDEVLANRGRAAWAIETVAPDIIVVGSDWLVLDYLDQLGVDEPWLRQRQIAVCFVPRTDGVSSTELRTALA